MSLVRRRGAVAGARAAGGPVTADITATLPALEQSATGTALVAGAVSGDIAATLPALTQSAAGSVEVRGDIAATLPALTQAATGTVTTPIAAGDTTYHSIGSASSISVNKPTGVVEGTLMLVNLATRGAYADSVPTGWTLVNRARSGSGGLDAATSVYAKIAGASEPSGYTFSLESARPVSISCVAIDGADSVDDSAGAFTTSGSGVAPSVTDGFADALLYVCWSGRSMVWNDPAVPSGMTEVLELTSAELDVDLTQLIGTEVLDADGSTGTRTSDVASASGDAAHVSVVILPPGVGGS